MSQTNFPTGNSPSLVGNIKIISADDYYDLVSTIERKVKLIDSITTDKEFFLQLGDFYKFLEKEPILASALEIIHSDYTEESKALDTLRNTVGQEVEEAFTDIRSIVLKNGLVKESDLQVIEEYYGNYAEYREGKKKVTDEQAKIINQHENRILDEIKGYYSFLAGASQSLTGTPFQSIMVGAVEAIVRACKETGRVDVVQKYVDLEKSSTTDEMLIINYKVSPTDEEFREKKKTLDRKLEPSAWHAVQMIQLVPLTMYDYHDYWNELKTKHDYAEMMGLGGYIGAMNTIMEGRKPEMDWFNTKEYQLYLKRLVDSIFDVLSKMRRLSQEAGPEFKKGETVTFQNDVIFFKLGDGSWDSIDLSNAQELLKVFRSFWELRKRHVNQDLFAPEVVIKTYGELNKGETIDRRHLATLISNLRQTKVYPKPNLRERFLLDFDIKDKKWRFNIS